MPFYICSTKYFFDRLNVEFYHAGFLTYEHASQPVDAVVTTFAFHLLPDFWKGIALKRLNSMLKPGGKLYIHDVIIEGDNAIKNIQALIDKLNTAGGQASARGYRKAF
ncbi:MAG: class I SAM-dependent methyltransferase [Thermodesulfobacteriota bacterium]|nr:class I SAM-dependent methyltransferase [Thermodesulfobacteriota bacterium]